MIILQRNKINIIDFALCDFRPMFEFYEVEKAKKKALSTAEKKELKKAKEEVEAKYMTCLLDGRKEKVGNFKVEPPGLFRGRGEHPKKGALKVVISSKMYHKLQVIFFSFACAQKILRLISARRPRFLFQTLQDNGSPLYTTIP